MNRKKEQDMKTTKSDVREDFKMMRQLMRQANQMMQDGITDYDPEGEAYQLALYLSACSSTFEEYITERHYASED
jgi:hypothetical protein